VVVDVELLVPYSRIAGARSLSLDIQGNSLDILVNALIERFPALETHLKGEEIPGAAPFFMLINGKIISVEKQSDILFEEGDVIAFTRIVAGG